jgi:hypothetical protein
MASAPLRFLTPFLRPSSSAPANSHNSMEPELMIYAHERLLLQPVVCSDILGDPKRASLEERLRKAKPSRSLSSIPIHPFWPH